MSSFEASDLPTIVIDNGSDTCKAGYAGEDAPSLVIPTIVGRPKSDTFAYIGRSFVGEEAQRKAGILHLRCPIEYRSIEDWEGMKWIWEHALQILAGLQDDGSRVLLTEPVYNLAVAREKIAAIMFEKFNVSALSLQVTPPLCLYATGTTTGLVVESGHSLTNYMPIHEGNIIREGVSSEYLGGQDLTQHLTWMLNDANSGATFQTTAERFHVRVIKETLAYVALDYDMAMQKAAREPMDLQAIYELPDGAIVVVDSERFRCTEPIFHPSLLGKCYTGMHDYLYRAIQKCDAAIRPVLYRNIVLAGGNTLFSGLPQRLSQEVRNLAHPSVTVKVTAAVNGKYAAWIGGSVLASQTTTTTSTTTMEQGGWLSKAEYEEWGPSGIHRTCPAL